MNCPHCASLTTQQQQKTATLSYRTLRCWASRRIFNERTGLPSTCWNILPISSCLSFSGNCGTS